MKGTTFNNQTLYQTQPKAKPENVIRLHSKAYYIFASSDLQLDLQLATHLLAFKSKSP